MSAQETATKFAPSDRASVAGGQLVGQSRQGSVAPKAAVKLRLDLNLEVEIAIQAKVNGDITLSLLAVDTAVPYWDLVPLPTPTPTPKVCTVLWALQMSEEMQKVYCPACRFDVATPVTRFTSTPSPFSILITTNGRVSPSDDDLLSHYLQGVRADISAQDDVIRRIKSALTRAENEKNRLQGVFDSHAALRSPVRKCPPEVLTEIFHWTIATLHNGNHLGLRELNARLSKISADAPQLRALVLDGNIPVQTLALPWTQIISLDINYVIDRDDLSAVLSMTPNLQVLTLEYDEVNRRTDGWKSRKSEDIVTCPSLRRVHVTDLALFQSFNFPSLEELSLRLLGVAPDWLGRKDDKKMADIFHGFLERSGSPIKKLKLEDTADVPDFPRTFHMAFRLVDLDITLPDPATAALFFRALLSTGDKTDVLPELRSLKAECCAVTHVKDLVEVDDIADMIESRYHPPNAAVAEIQSVHITLPYLSLLRRQSFQARLKNLPDLLNLTLTRDEIYILFVWSDERLIGLLASHIFDMSAMLFMPEFIQSVANSLEESDPSFLRPYRGIHFERDFGCWFNHRWTKRLRWRPRRATRFGVISVSSIFDFLSFVSASI
ncbi:uncharacterized protein ARMOST_17259 [Armillaria ostoyae]|uniref:F-box domain-containing protein n=1 Tax=Armillaria ostoyae TaxID=47428 RepID=A0A284RYG5_ARMOS|nr:uncharacterized protein ARMOST_17259 [Armillaria ostoyae]